MTPTSSRLPFSVRRGFAGASFVSLAVMAGFAGSFVPAAAASGTQTMTASTGAGGLSVSAPTAINLGGAIAPGTTTSAIALGSVSWTDTLNDATASSLTLAATDLYNATGPKVDAFTNFSIGVGQVITTTTGNTGSSPVAGVAGPTALAGTDTTPGTTFSGSITLAGASATTEGTWTQPGNTITVMVPANLANSGVLTSTIQYTVTG